MRAMTIFLAFAAFACKGGAGTEYKHDEPRFKVTIPEGLQQGPIKPDADGGGTLAFKNDDGSRDILLVWARSGSPYDPEAQWSRYGKEPDHVKTIAEGKLPGDVGKWIEHDRGRTYVHAVMSARSDDLAGPGGWGVLCMTSTPTAKPDAALIAACKTLTSW